MSIILKPTGFWVEEWRPKKKQYVLKKMSNDFSLLLHMQDDFTIEGEPTFGQMISAIKKWDIGAQTVVSMICGSNFRQYLQTIDEPLDTQKTIDKPLKSIEVYTYWQADNFDNIKEMDIKTNWGCHGIGEPWEIGEGNSYAIEFTPWNELRDVKMTIASHGRYCDDRYASCRPRKVFSSGPNEKWNSLERKRISSSSHKFRTPSIKFIEFLTAVFGELAFFSAPARRDKEKTNLKQILTESDKFFEKTK